MKVCTNERAVYCYANALCGCDNTAQGDRAVRNHTSAHMFARKSMRKGQVIHHGRGVVSKVDAVLYQHNKNPTYISVSVVRLP